MSRPRKVQTSGKEKLAVWVSAESDPTAHTIEFALVDETATEDDPATRDAGTWVSGSWDAAAGRAQALSPTVGEAAATITIVEGTTYRIHVRVTTGSEVVDRELGRRVVGV